MKNLPIIAAAAVLLAGTAGADAPMTFDVAEDHTRFIYAPEPVHENGMPAHGNPFITQGYLYPAGTLADGVSGVHEDGSPRFPELVIGTWTCDGWFVGDGGNAETGVWLVSRQIYEFEDGDMLITQGTELADVGVENARPITGGKGIFAQMDGVVSQTLLGFSDHFSVNATFRVDPVKKTAWSNTGNE